METSCSTLIGGGTDLGDVGSPVGNGPIYIGVETPFKLSDRLPIATTGRATDIHREKSRTKMEGPSDQGMDSMPLFVVPFCANDPGDLTGVARHRRRGRGDAPGRGVRARLRLRADRHRGPVQSAGTLSVASQEGAQHGAREADP